mgnify:CR=1 FL=1
MSAQTADPRPGGTSHPGWHRGVFIFVAIATLAGVLVFAQSQLAFLAAMTDGLIALGIVAAASAAGLWLVWGTGNSDLPIRWQIGLGAGFGLGVLSLGMLWAGLRAHMGQKLWIIIIALLAVAGLAAIYRLSRMAMLRSRIAPTEQDLADARTAGPWHWLWLLIVPAVVLSVLVATVPPGLLWDEEGNGYDALEYHLGVPKEWFFLGRIEYLDHNMYSNFPMNAEMLYLLTMILQASPFKAAITAQMVNLLLAGLAGYAAWLTGRDYSRKAGIFTGIAGATFPWLIYLSGVAYVENGMLFYGLLAAGLCNRAIRDADERCWSRALALGAMVGLACGYKYTAFPMIALPLLAVWFLLNVAPRPRKVSNAIIPFVIAGAFFGPWLAKNQRMTGDPVFPLGYKVFGSRVWTDAEHGKFRRGHAPLSEEKTVSARLQRFGQRVIADPRFGYVPWLVVPLAAGLAILPRPSCRRESLIWLAILALQVLLWLFTTHLLARFAGILWMPLVFLVAALADWACQPHSPGRTPGASSVPQRRQEIAQDVSPGKAGSHVSPVVFPHKSRRDDRPLEPRAGRSRTPAMLLCLAGLLVYLAVGQFWLWREYRRHVYVNGRQLPIHGMPEAFFFGYMPAFRHLSYINGDNDKEPGLPYNARLLMVADARIFYVARRADYCVTFSRNPLARAIDEAGNSPEGVIRWFRDRGYTHIWTDFAEMHRLAGTYGFPAQITPDLFSRLEQAGLKRLHEVHFRQDGFPYGILYEVPAR